MSRIRKIILFLLCAVLATSLLLVACKDKTGDEDSSGEKQYSIYVRSLGGVGLPNVSVSVSLPKSTVSERTDSTGKITFKAEKGEYTVTVTNLPIGYTLAANNRYKTSADNLTLIIYATSAVIDQTIPTDKIYKVGDVAYDFSITDKTGSEDVTYTLSEVLEEKKMVLLNLWNVNCVPCMMEMPELELAYNDYKEDVEIFGVNVPTMGENTQRDVNSTRRATYTNGEGESYSLTFPLALDSNNMPFHFNVNAIPVSVVIDRYGVIALIHAGSMDKTGFASLFAKYVSDDYVQDNVFGGDDDGNEGEILERVKPNVSQPASATIQAAVNGANFNGTWYPETQTSDAEYSWPWLVGESGGYKYIYPANHEVNYSFATIYTDVTVSQADVDSGNGKVVLAFDLQWSCENLYDSFYVIVNNKLVYEYTGTEQWGHWQDCYALVADEAGKYTLCLMYVKDPQISAGEDTVRIKNVRMISTSDIAVDSLDMPRDAAKGWNGSNFTNYIRWEKDEQGFYHKDSADGPYILADLMSTTSFNNRLTTDWSIAEFAVYDFFNYNGVDSDDPAYKPDKDDTDAISEWAEAANNSELYGLTVVNDDLIALLNRFIKTQVDNFNDNIWLEFCKYFDHYGTDPKDSGISTPDRNPIRGLLNITAIPTVEAHNGAFEDLNNIPDEFKNLVVFTRQIVPRGYKYLFVPDKDGAYRFRSQSSYLSDTMAWLHTFDGKLLVDTDMQLENPDKEYNFVLTYYLKAGQEYVLTTCLSDVNSTGEYTFTVEYIDEYFYSWQYAARDFLTTKDETMSEVVNLLNVQPVLHEGVYYNAKKDEQGNYILVDGKYVANTDDPIYVDFLTGARFFDNGSLESVFEYSKEEKVIDTISGVWSIMFHKIKPAGGWSRNTTLISIKGEALTAEDWEEFITQVFLIYGDIAYIDDDNYIEMLVSCNNIGQVADVIRVNYLNLFDQRKIRYDDSFGIDASRYKDYTSLVYGFYQQAKEFQGTASRGYADKGCVIVTAELADALDMFCKRVGGFPELDTDWLRMCAHFEYIGPYVAGE